MTIKVIFPELSIGFGTDRKVKRILHLTQIGLNDIMSANVSPGKDMTKTANRKHEQYPFKKKNSYEQLAWQSGKLVCGIDEVGRGSLAGCSLVLPSRHSPH